MPGSGPGSGLGAAVGSLRSSSQDARSGGDGTSEWSRGAGFLGSTACTEAGQAAWCLWSERAAGPAQQPGSAAVSEPENSAAPGGGRRRGGQASELAERLGPSVTRALGGAERLTDFYVSRSALSM